MTGGHWEAGTSEPCALNLHFAALEVQRMEMQLKHSLWVQSMLTFEVGSDNGHLDHKLIIVDSHPLNKFNQHFARMR